MSSHHRGKQASNPTGKKAKLLSPGILHDYSSLSSDSSLDEAIAEIADSSDDSSSSSEDDNEPILPDRNPEDFIPGEIWATKESVNKNTSSSSQSFSEVYPCSNVYGECFEISFTVSYAYDPKVAGIALVALIN